MRGIINYFATFLLILSYHIGKDVTAADRYSGDWWWMLTLIIVSCFLFWFAGRRTDS